MTRESAVSIEIDDADRDLYFAPLGRRVRGRVDPARVTKKNADAARLMSEWPVVPGQVLGYDFASGCGFISEPLHTEEHASVREHIEKKGFGLEPEKQVFQGQHAATWVYWMSRAVESGMAKVVSGAFPSKLDGEPRKRFLVAEQPSTTDKLVAVLERQAELIEALLQKL